MDICYLKNAEFRPKIQKHKGRFVLRGDTVKDDSGAYAVFTEQGSSSSQMTAAKVMDVIARLPDSAGQAADAGCSKIAQNSKVRVSRSKTQWFLLNEICSGTRLLASPVGKTIKGGSF